MVVETPFLHCFFCGRRFPANLEAREGMFIHAWKVAVCPVCLVGNRDGLSADHPAIKQLAERGIKVEATGTGIVPWPDNQGARPRDQL
jgi:hypothetical protein